MAERSRETPWRQGHFLNSDSIDKLDLRSKEHPENTVVIMASHDCDLPQSPALEPFFEVIVGRFIENMDGSSTNTKSPRKLHIEIETPAGKKPAEFIAAHKISTPKDELPRISHTPDFALDDDSLCIFKRWLGIRYSRGSFAGEFESRLKTNPNKLHVKIEQATKKHGDLISAVFFDVDEGKEVARTVLSDIYTLDITILYSTKRDPITAEAAAKTACDEIITAFEDKLYDKTNKTWESIELRHCEPISDEVLSYKQSTLWKQWRFEHISFAQEPPHPIVDSD